MQGTMQLSEKVREWSGYEPLGSSCDVSDYMCPGRAHRIVPCSRAAPPFEGAEVGDSFVVYTKLFIDVQLRTPGRAAWALIGTEKPSAGSVFRAAGT